MLRLSEVLLFLVFTVYCDVECAHYRVSSDCSSQRIHEECHTLNYYLARASNYLESANSTFVIDKGEHFLQLKDHALVKVSNLVFQGVDDAASSTIRCTNLSSSSIITFIGGNVILSKLTFIDCGGNSFPFQFDLLNSLRINEIMYHGVQLKISDVATVAIRRCKLEYFNRNSVLISKSGIVSVDDTIANGTWLQVQLTHSGSDLSISNSLFMHGIATITVYATSFNIAIENTSVVQSIDINIPRFSKDSFGDKTGFPNNISLIGNAFKGRLDGIVVRTSIALNASSVAVTIQECLFAHNHSLSLSVASDRASVVLRYCLFTDTFTGLDLVAQSCNVQVANCSFYENHGHAVNALLANATVHFTNVSVTDTSYALGQSGALSFTCFSPTDAVTLENILIANSAQTGLVSSGCLLIFTGRKNTIRKNWSPGFGGGISLNSSHSRVSIDKHSSLTLAGNIALFGGGMYANNTNMCPFGESDASRVMFRGNRGLISGNNVFGLLLELCGILGEANSISTDVHNTRVCLCHNSEVDCSRRVHYHRRLHSPHDSKDVSVGLMGPRGKLLPPNITVAPDTGRTIKFITTEDNCAVVSLPYYCSKREEERLVLSFSDSSRGMGIGNGISIDVNTGISDDNLDDLEVVLDCNYQEHKVYKRDALVIQTLNCSFGFELDEATGACVCNKNLEKLVPTLECNISNTKEPFSKEDSNWVWYDEENDCVFVQHCPYNFCTKSRTDFTFNGSNSSTCVKHREGLLCSACQEGYTIKLGTNTCVKCDNMNLMLVVLIAFVVGVVIIFVLLFNITVADGGFNGLIFYANMVKLNEVVFFHPWTDYQIIPLTQFIGWINLDTGLTSCFTNNLNIYTTTWMEYTYPGVLFLVSCLLLVFHCIPWCTENAIKNMMPYVGMFVLLSYTKLLRNAAVALPSVTLTCQSLEPPGNNTNTTTGEEMDMFGNDTSNGTNETYGPYSTTVWPLDASLPYGSNRHAGLVAVACITVVLCAVFLFYIWVFPLLGRLISFHRRLASFKQFAEAFYAPFKPKYKFWVGIELGIRPLLILIFGLVHQDYSTNPYTYILGFVAGTMLAAQLLLGRVHKKLYLSLLDLFHLFNLLCLCLISAAAIHFDSKALQYHATIVSVSFCMVAFVGTAVFNLVMRFKNSQFCQHRSMQLPDMRHRTSEVVRLLSNVVNDHNSSDEEDNNEIRHIIMMNQEPRNDSPIHIQNDTQNRTQNHNINDNNSDDSDDDVVEPDSPHPYVSRSFNTNGPDASGGRRGPTTTIPSSLSIKPLSDAIKAVVSSPRSPHTPRSLNSPRHPRVVVINLGESQEETDETKPPDDPIKQDSIIELEENV